MQAHLVRVDARECVSMSGRVCVCLCVESRTRSLTSVFVVDCELAPRLLASVTPLTSPLFPSHVSPRSVPRDVVKRLVSPASSDVPSSGAPSKGCSRTRSDASRHKGQLSAACDQSLRGHRRPGDQSSGGGGGGDTEYRQPNARPKAQTTMPRMPNGEALAVVGHWPRWMKIPHASWPEP